jgi:hypothetical protein
MPTTLPYLLQEPETGLYLAHAGDGALILKRDPKSAIGFQTSAHALEFASSLRDAPIELVRVAA